MLLLGLNACGCTSDVSLGRWGRQVVGTDTQPSEPPQNSSPSDRPTDPSSPGSAANSMDQSDAATESRTSPTASTGDAAADAGSVPNPVPACLEGLGGGAPSVLGDNVVVTETSTDWSLPEPTTGMEWTLTIEKDVPQVATQVGYYWHNQFSFVPGIAGRLGVQTNGYYQADPAVVGEIVPMAVFWLSGPPLAAELGNIDEARVADERAVGLDWKTIHAKFDWQVCHTYRFRVDIESTEPNGNMWYGAWITDETTGEVKFLGRMLLPSDSGLLSTLTSTRTSPIRYAPTGCDQLYGASAIFGAPVAADGQVAERVANHFFQPFGCRYSFIADYDGAVRHEMSVAP